MKNGRGGNANLGSIIPQPINVSITSEKFVYRTSMACVAVTVIAFVDCRFSSFRMNNYTYTHNYKYTWQTIVPIRIHCPRRRHATHKSCSTRMLPHNTYPWTICAGIHPVIIVAINRSNNKLNSAYFEQIQNKTYNWIE